VRARAVAATRRLPVSDEALGPLTEAPPEIRPEDRAEANRLRIACAARARDPVTFAEVLNSLKRLPTLTGAAGARTGWPAAWRDLLRALRTHPALEVRHAALAQVTIGE
jgi:hypothetical protein